MDPTAVGRGLSAGRLILPALLLLREINALYDTWRAPPIPLADRSVGWGAGRGDRLVMCWRHRLLDTVACEQLNRMCLCWPRLGEEVGASATPVCHSFCPVGEVGCATGGEGGMGRRDQESRRTLAGAWVSGVPSVSPWNLVEDKEKLPWLPSSDVLRSLRIRLPAPAALGADRDRGRVGV